MSDYTGSYDAMAQELARLRTENAELRQQLADKDNVICHTQLALDALRPQLAAAQVDAERYRYIRNERRTTAIYEYYGGVRLLKLDGQLDAAIDAARGT